MRPLAILILLLASRGLAPAQMQESKMAERLLQPDRTLGNSAQNKTYYGTGGGGLDISKEANIKDFYFVQKFSSKDYDTKEYAARDYWGGEFEFTTRAASIKADEAGQKVFATKTVAVKDAREAGRGFDAGKGAFGIRTAPVEGKTSQNHLDEIHKGKSQMDIDQVRDLLNKPRLFN